MWVSPEPHSQAPPTQEPGLGMRQKYEYLLRWYMFFLIWYKRSLPWPWWRTDIKQLQRNSWEVKWVSMVIVGSSSTTIQCNVTFACSLVEVEGSGFDVLWFQFVSPLHRACSFLLTTQMLETSILVCVGGGEEVNDHRLHNLQKSHHSCQGGIGLSWVEGWS